MIILMHAEKYISAVIVSGFLISVNSGVLSAGEMGVGLTSASTQGHFAVSLAESLGHSGLEEKEAIKLLSGLAISPGAMPARSQWQADQVATTQFVAHIQASIQLMLKKVAEKSKIPPPPTLDLMIFEAPPAPQSIFFPVANNESSAAGLMKNNVPPPTTSIPLPSTEIMQSMPIEVDTIGGGSAYPENEVVSSAVSSNLTERIDQAVIINLQKQDKVAVIVELKPTLAVPLGVAVEDIIAKEQKAVLDTLSADEFKLKHRYVSIYTFSGWISNDGVKKLEKNSFILRVSLDELNSVQK